MIRILIADDHEIVRRGIKQIIEETSDLEVIGEASTGQQVIDAVSRLSPDVLLLDISMPGYSGLDVLKTLAANFTDLPVLVLTMHPEEQYAIRVLKAGASGYLTKESAPDELIAAIRKVSTGGRYVSPNLAETLALHVQKGIKTDLHEQLSDREYQVFLLLAQGKTVSQIGEELTLSVKTISTYRSRIMNKMHFSNNIQIIQYALRHDLIDE
jgi:DNA-binding NarL/FixJ family response regulator